MKRDESQNVEYKESWHDKYLACICGYANAQGGTIYFGIEDGTKKPVGVKNANKLMEDVPNKIRDTMGIVADVALLRKIGKDVIRVKVKKSMFPVCYHGEYHYRTGAVKMILAGSSLTQFLLEKSGLDWDAAPTFSGFKKDEHAFTTLAARYKKERKVKLLDSDFESFGLALPDGRLTNAGAILADDQIGLTQLYNKFHDQSVDDVRIVDLRQLQVKIDNAVRDAYGWTDLDLEHGFHEVGYLPANDNIRFTISESARIEVLKRLAKLNKERWEEEEAAGLHKKGKK